MKRILSLLVALVLSTPMFSAKPAARPPGGAPVVQEAPNQEVYEQMQRAGIEEPKEGSSYVPNFDGLSEQFRPSKPLPEDLRRACVGYVGLIHNDTPFHISVRCQYRLLTENFKVSASSPTSSPRYIDRVASIFRRGSEALGRAEDSIGVPLVKYEPDDNWGSGYPWICYHLVTIRAIDYQKREATLQLNREQLSFCHKQKAYISIEEDANKQLVIVLRSVE